VCNSKKGTKIEQGHNDASQDSPKSRIFCSLDFQLSADCYLRFIFGVSPVENDFLSVATHFLSKTAKAKGMLFFIVTSVNF